MATYNKRGYKPKTKEEKQKAEVTDSTTAEVFKTLDVGATKAEQWLERNKKIVFGVIGLFIIIVLGFFGYKEFILKPKQEEALNQMYTAKTYFEEAVNGVGADSLFKKSLKGANGKYGMLDIIENYSGTKAANLANYYAGMAYYNLKDYKNAVTYLSDFSSDDKMLNPIAKGTIADAFVQLKQPKEALEYYDKAIKANTNDFTTPFYLLKASRVAISLKNFELALEYLNRIKEEFSKSEQALNIDVYIGLVEAKM